MRSSRKVGTVYLVGAGPGDPKLLTLRARELLGQAEVVVYDHLVAPEVLEHCPEGAKLIYMGKETRTQAGDQAAINQLLVRSARRGKMVVRLKGGDPFLFGRGGEEASVLADAGIAFEVVPGVTSALAVPAYAGIPLTHRELASSVAILTGHENPAKKRQASRWDRTATSCDTLVFLMGVKTLSGIVDRLLRAGRAAATPAAVIEWGTRARQRTRVGTLKTIVREMHRAQVKPPAILIVGEVVSLRRRLNWFESRPLFGQRVLVTRASDKAGPMAERLEALGADVRMLPAIRLAPAKRNGAFRSAVQEMPRTDWAFFTSPEGIAWLARMLRPYRKDLRALSHCHIAAIGPKTAASIEAAGLHVDFIPRSFSQEGMARDLPSSALKGKRGVILSAQDSRDALMDGLRRRGMSVRKVPIYQTIIPEEFLRGVKEAFRDPFDWVTVTSASCVDHLIQGFRHVGRPSLFAKQRFACIGPVTARAVRDRGGRVAVEAKVSTIEGLIEVMCSARRPASGNPGASAIAGRCRPRSRKSGVTSCG